MPFSIFVQAMAGSSFVLYVCNVNSDSNFDFKRSSYYKTANKKHDIISTVLCRSYGNNYFKNEYLLDSFLINEHTSSSLNKTSDHSSHLFLPTAVQQSNTSS